LVFYSSILFGHVSIGWAWQTCHTATIAGVYLSDLLAYFVVRFVREDHQTHKSILNRWPLALTISSLSNSIGRFLVGRYDLPVVYYLLGHLIFFSALFLKFKRLHDVKLTVIDSNILQNEGNKAAIRVRKLIDRPID